MNEFPRTTQYDRINRLALSMAVFLACCFAVAHEYEIAAVWLLLWVLGNGCVAMLDVFYMFITERSFFGTGTHHPASVKSEMTRQDWLAEVDYIANHPVANNFSTAERC
jgi:hypothetical protein